MSNTYDNYYSNQYLGEKYASVTEMEQHPFFPEIKKWIDQHPDFKAKKYLEIGSGRGGLQDVIDDYTGIDYASSVEKYYHKPFICGSAEKMPFDNDSFDVVWSYAVWEHIPDPEKAFDEVVRILRKDGFFILRPAWHCRPWAANGYQVRPYSDFNLCGKAYKFIIPLLNFLPIRIIKMFFFRIRICILRLFFKSKRIPLFYKKLKANYEVFWQSDSDACNDLDLFPVIIWFENRGFKCVSHPSRYEQFMCRTGTVVFQKVK